MEKWLLRNLAQAVDFTVLYMLNDCLWDAGIALFGVVFTGFGGVFNVTLIVIGWYTYVYNRSRNVLRWLWHSCGIAHCGWGFAFFGAFCWYW